ncbi:Ubiquitin conjugation factor E4 [Ophidiomyces ophidiicola]|nr:Ubiquitin conjugation factor E4 [Ophidiomyces ophidiicola]
MDDSVDLEKTRNKRLAKLDAQKPVSSSASQEGTASAVEDNSRSTAPPAQDSEASRFKRPHTNISQPFERGMDTSGGGSPAIRITKSAAQQRAEESLETFEDRTLSALFKVTLDEKQQRDIHGQKLVYIPGVRQELEDQGQPIRMNTGVLDQALLEAGSSGQKPLEYLLPCWKRVTRLYKGFKKSQPNDAKYEVVTEARRLCLSYCIFAFTMPEMFGLDTPLSSPLKPYLLQEPDCDIGLCHDFMLEAIRRAEEDDTIIPAFISAVEEMSRDISSLSLNDDYKLHMMAFRNLVRFPTLASAITESPMFNLDVGAGKFETATLLGPWFRLSPLQKQTTMTYFSSPKTKDQAAIISAQRSMRMTQQLHSSDLVDIINHLVRASKSARERVLDWFAASVNINHKRRALQVNPEEVSSDGFMFNITTCLDQLCEPFMDAAFTKIDRIDSNYLKINPRVNIKDETKMNADQKASDEFYSQTMEGESNFISEVFFLTVAAHHYGSESLTSTMEQLEKDLRHMQTQIDKFERERPKWSANPVQARMFEAALKKYKDRVDLGLALKYSFQAVLLDDLWQARSMQFMRYVIVWMLRLVSGRNFPKEPLELPLPVAEPDVFKCLPEYFLDDVVSNFKFIIWNMPHIVTSTQGDELIMLCITFLQSSEYIKNPYLKAGLITILFCGTWNRPHGGRGVLVDLLNSIPFANKYLLHALLKFYIEAEFTGTHTQFFDKFNIRLEIFQIIKCIWPNAIYRDQLSNEAKKNSEFFIQFVNLLLNDVTFVLDESFTAFLAIHDTQVELRENGASMDENTRQEKEEQLSAAQGRAKSYMQLTNETVTMLKLFTEALADSFTMPEIVQRLADMLNYNLDAMVGPKSANLRVDNLASYHFNPRSLLSEIVDVYLNLMAKDNFILAVARDGRSYKPANFDTAADILKKWALKPQDDLIKWGKLKTKVKEAKDADDQAEEDLGEIPDEFLDPLMFTLMEDPVQLPSSKISIDRSTIRSHLLSDPNDPFNRAPLKIEDVIPDTDLKAKIEAFKTEKKATKLASLKGTTENMDAMDTSSG